MQFRTDQLSVVISTQATVQVSRYGEIDFTAMRPIVPPPLDNTEIKYATVKNAV